MKKKFNLCNTETKQKRQLYRTEGGHFERELRRERDFLCKQVVAASKNCDVVTSQGVSQADDLFFSCCQNVKRNNDLRILEDNFREKCYHVVAERGMDQQGGEKVAECLNSTEGNAPKQAPPLVCCRQPADTPLLQVSVLQEILGLEQQLVWIWI